MRQFSRVKLNRWPDKLRTKRMQVFAGAAFSIVLAWAAINGLDWERVREAFKEFPYQIILISIVPFFIGMALRSARWHILLAGHKIKPIQTFLAQNMGIGLNNVLPIRMVSEPIQLIVMTKHYGVPGATALATLVAGNVLDIFATALLMALGVAVAPELRSLNVQIAGAFILSIVSVLVFIVLAKGLTWIPIANRIHFFQQLATSLVLLKKQPRRIVLSLLFTLSHWFLVGTSGWIIAESLGLDLNVWVITSLLVGTTFFVSAMPSLPGGIGTFEVAIISSLRILGVDHTTAFTYGIVMHVLVFLPSTLIAIGMLMRFGSRTFFQDRHAN